jgi:hypothetical protein
VSDRGSVSEKEWENSSKSNNSTNESRDESEKDTSNSLYVISGNVNELTKKVKETAKNIKGRQLKDAAILGRNLSKSNHPKFSEEFHFPLPPLTSSTPNSQTKSNSGCYLLSPQNTLSLDETGYIVASSSTDSCTSKAKSRSFPTTSQKALENNSDPFSSFSSFTPQIPSSTPTPPCHTPSHTPPCHTPSYSPPSHTPICHTQSYTPPSHTPPSHTLSSHAPLPITLFLSSADSSSVDQQVNSDKSDSSLTPSLFTTHISEMSDGEDGDHLLPELEREKEKKKQQNLFPKILITSDANPYNQESPVVSSSPHFPPKTLRQHQKQAQFFEGTDPSSVIRCNQSTSVLDRKVQFATKTPPLRITSSTSRNRSSTPDNSPSKVTHLFGPLYPNSVIKSSPKMRTEKNFSSLTQSQSIQNSKNLESQRLSLSEFQNPPKRRGSVSSNIPDNIKRRERRHTIEDKDAWGSILRTLSSDSGEKQFDMAFQGDWNVRFQICVKRLNRLNGLSSLAERVEVNSMLMHLSEGFTLLNY